jgi:hypothetical protein
MDREWWRGRQASRAWYDVGDATRSKNTGAVGGGAAGAVVGGPIGAVVGAGADAVIGETVRARATITITGIIGTITATIAIPKDRRRRLRQRLEEPAMRYASKGCGAK